MRTPGPEDKIIHCNGALRMVSMKFTPRGKKFIGFLNSLESIEQEAIKLTRWQDDLRSMGKFAAADALNERLEQIERTLRFYY